METVSDIARLRELVGGWRSGGRTVGFVPTMGNLHAGHLALVDRARQLADRVVASVFVNPTQFGPGEDFDAYPRTLDEDRAALAEHGCDLMFAPTVSGMYPYGPEAAVAIRVPGITDILEGRHRPGHFDGVATVVARLFHMVTPHLALFGEKDYQQLQVIRYMTRDLAIPVEVVGAPTVRADDGLALSSRNRYLTAAERQRAPALYRALRTAASALEGGSTGFGELEAEGERALADSGFEPDYFQVRRPDLAPPEPGDRTFVVLAAARLGRARLIDNLRASRNGGVARRKGG